MEARRCTASLFGSWSSTCRRRSHRSSLTARPSSCQACTAPWNSTRNFLPARLGAAQSRRGRGRGTAQPQRRTVKRGSRRRAPAPDGGGERPRRRSRRARRRRRRRRRASLGAATRAGRVRHLIVAADAGHVAEGGRRSSWRNARRWFTRSGVDDLARKAAARRDHLSAVKRRRPPSSHPPRARAPPLIERLRRARAVSQPDVGAVKRDVTTNLHRSCAAPGPSSPPPATLRRSTIWPVAGEPHLADALFSQPNPVGQLCGHRLHRRRRVGAADAACRSRRLSSARALERSARAASSDARARVRRRAERAASSCRRCWWAAPRACAACGARWPASRRCVLHLAELGERARRALGGRPAPAARARWCAARACCSTAAPPPRAQTRLAMRKRELCVFVRDGGRLCAPRWRRPAADELRRLDAAIVAAAARHVAARLALAVASRPPVPPRAPPPRAGRREAPRTRRRAAPPRRRGGEVGAARRLSRRTLRGVERATYCARCCRAALSSASTCSLARRRRTRVGVPLGAAAASIPCSTSAASAPADASAAATTPSSATRGWRGRVQLGHQRRAVPLGLRVSAPLSSRRPRAVAPPGRDASVAPP